MDKVFELAGRALALDYAARQDDSITVSGASNIAACALVPANLDIPGLAAVCAHDDASRGFCVRPHGQDEQGSNHDGHLESGSH